MYGDYTRKDQIEDVFRAVGEGNLGELAYYLDDSCDPDLRHENGRTLLVQAMISRKDEAALLLLEKGASPDLAVAATGQTALHYAAAAGNTRLITALLAHGATLDFPDDFRWTPLHQATASGKLEAVKALVAAGASLEARDDQNDRPLDLATLRAAHSLEVISKPYPPIVAYLKERMAGAQAAFNEAARHETVEQDIAALKRLNPARFRLKM